MVPINQPLLSFSINTLQLGFTTQIFPNYSRKGHGKIIFRMNVWSLKQILDHHLVGKTRFFRQKHRILEANLDFANIHRCLESHRFYILNLVQELEKWICFLQLSEKISMMMDSQGCWPFWIQTACCWQGSDDLNFKTIYKSSQVVQISGVNMLSSIQSMWTKLKTLFLLLLLFF